MKNSFHSDNFISLSFTVTVSIPSPPVPIGLSKELYPTDFLHSSDRKCLSGNYVIYRKLIEKAGFIDKVPAASDLYEYMLKNGATVENVY